MPGTGRPHEAGVALARENAHSHCCCKLLEAETGLKKLSTLLELQPAFWDSEAVAFSTTPSYLRYKHLIKFLESLLMFL